MCNQIIWFNSLYLHINEEKITDYLSILAQSYFQLSSNERLIVFLNLLKGFCDDFVLDEKKIKNILDLLVDDEHKKVFSSSIISKLKQLIENKEHLDKIDLYKKQLLNIIFLLDSLDMMRMSIQEIKWSPAELDSICVFYINRMKKDYIRKKKELLSLDDIPGCIIINNEKILLNYYCQHFDFITNNIKEIILNYVDKIEFIDNQNIKVIALDIWQNIFNHPDCQKYKCIDINNENYRNTEKEKKIIEHVIYNFINVLAHCRETKGKTIFTLLLDLMKKDCNTRDYYKYFGVFFAEDKDLLCRQINMKEIIALFPDEEKEDYISLFLSLFINKEKDDRLFVNNIVMEALCAGNNYQIIDNLFGSIMNIRDISLVNFLQFVNQRGYDKEDIEGLARLKVFWEQLKECYTVDYSRDKSFKNVFIRIIYKKIYADVLSGGLLLNESKDYVNLLCQCSGKDFQINNINNFTVDRCKEIIGLLLSQKKLDIIDYFLEKEIIDLCLFTSYIVKYLHSDGSIKIEQENKNCIVITMQELFNNMKYLGNLFPENMEDLCSIYDKCNLFDGNNAIIFLSLLYEKIIFDNLSGLNYNNKNAVIDFVNNLIAKVNYCDKPPKFKKEYIDNLQYLWNMILDYKKLDNNYEKMINILSKAINNDKNLKVLDTSRKLHYQKLCQKFYNNSEIKKILYKNKDNLLLLKDLSIETNLISLFNSVDFYSYLNVMISNIKSILTSVVKNCNDKMSLFYGLNLSEDHKNFILLCMHLIVYRGKFDDGTGANSKKISEINKNKSQNFDYRETYYQKVNQMLIQFNDKKKTFSEKILEGPIDFVDFKNIFLYSSVLSNDFKYSLNADNTKNADDTQNVFFYIFGKILNEIKKDFSQNTKKEWDKDLMFLDQQYKKKINIKKFLLDYWCQKFNFITTALKDIILQHVEKVNNFEDVNTIADNIWQEIFNHSDGEKYKLINIQNDDGRRIAKEKKIIEQVIYNFINVYVEYTQNKKDNDVSFLIDLLIRSYGKKDYYKYFGVFSAKDVEDVENPRNIDHALFMQSYIQQVIELFGTEEEKTKYLELLLSLYVNKEEEDRLFFNNIVMKALCAGNNYQVIDSLFKNDIYMTLDWFLSYNNDKEEKNLEEDIKKDIGCFARIESLWEKLRNKAHDMTNNEGRFFINILYGALSLEKSSYYLGLLETDYVKLFKSDRIIKLDNNKMKDIVDFLVQSNNWIMLNHLLEEKIIDLDCFMSHMVENINTGGLIAIKNEEEINFVNIKELFNIPVLFENLIEKYKNKDMSLEESILFLGFLYEKIMEAMLLPDDANKNNRSFFWNDLRKKENVNYFIDLFPTVIDFNADGIKDINKAFSLKQEIVDLLKNSHENNFSVNLKKKCRSLEEYNQMRRKVLFLICFYYDGQKDSSVGILSNVTILDLLVFYFLNKEYCGDKNNQENIIIQDIKENLKQETIFNLGRLINKNKLIYSSVASVLFLVICGLRMNGYQLKITDGWFLKMIHFVSSQIKNIEEKSFWSVMVVLGTALLLVNRYVVDMVTKKYSVLTLLL